MNLDLMQWCSRANIRKFPILIRKCFGFFASNGLWFTKETGWFTIWFNNRLIDVKSKILSENYLATKKMRKFLRCAIISSWFHSHFESTSQSHSMSTCCIFCSIKLLLLMARGSKSGGAHEHAAPSAENVFLSALSAGFTLKSGKRE